MADLTREEVIEKVKKGESLEEVDLSSLELSGAYLSGANLNFADLSNANLSNANLRMANLKNTKLSNTKLSNANLEGANLTTVNLTKANLEGAQLYKADLSYANLKGSYLINGKLVNANLESANLEGANFSNAILSNANLIKTNLEGAVLRDADLNHAVLSNAVLSNANVCKADLIYANLSNANLSEANFSNANFSRANLNYAHLCNAVFENAILFFANLSNANLSEANFSHANLCKADLSYANLTNVNLKNSYLVSVDFEFADLRKADISGANIFHYNTHGWKIEGIICTHVYSYPFKANEDEKEKSRRNFTVGEFEAIYKSIPTIDICFSDGFNNLDYLRLADIQEKIRLEMPDVGLRLKKLEREGFDMVVTLEVKEQNQIKDVSKKISKLYKDKKLEQVFKSEIMHIAEQKALQTVSKALGGLMVARDISIEKLEVHMPNKIINTDGKGNIVIVDSQFEKSAIGHEATVNIDYSQNYFTNQVAVDEKFDELRKKVSKDQQKLLDTIVKNLKKKQNSRAQNIWEQLKEGIKTSASAASILKTLADLLGFTI